MRQRALHAAAGATASEHRHHASSTGTDAVGKRTPSEYGLPAAPTPDRGLVPSGTVSETVPDAPLSAVHSQRFTAVPLSHDISVTETEAGIELTATITNTSEEPWAYRVPRGPAPLTGDRFHGADGELRVSAGEDEELFSDGVLAPGETVGSTLSVSALGGADGRWPRGEHTLLQPLTVWSEDAAYGYNWEVSLQV